jgi:predicted PurR-regulated permease PerM
VTTQNDALQRSRIDLALEASIHIGLAISLATACLLILRPFVPLLTWGIIIAVAAFPSFKRLQAALRGRGTLAAVIFTLLLLLLLIVPVVLLAGTLVDGAQTIATHFREGTLVIPPPPPGVENWPIIGGPVSKL